MGRINLKNVCFRFAGCDEYSLEDVSIEIEQGECVLLVGRSGSGKSTLLYCLSGLIPAYYNGVLHGDIRIGSGGGGSWADVPVWQKAATVGTVLQDPRHQFFSARVEQELLLSLSRSAPGRDEQGQRLVETMERLGLHALRHRLLESLSSGEQQRVAIGSAMIPAPGMLALDEPSANLSGDGLETLTRCLRLAKEAGTTIIIAEHRFSWLRQMADRLVILERGRVAYQGGAEKLDDVYFCKQHGLRFEPCDAPPSGPFDTNGTDHNVFLPAVLLEKVGFRHNRRQGWLWRGLTRGFQRADITAVSGRNGCGKTTLLGLIFGLKRPVEGSISFPRGVKPVSLALQHPDLQLFASTVAGEIGRAGREHEKWLRRFNLWHLRDRHPLTLSGGEMQRLVLAAAFGRVDEMPGSILLLDEPTSGMDGEQLAHLVNELERARAKGLCTIMATHDHDLIRMSGAKVFALDRRSGSNGFFDLNFCLTKKYLNFLKKEDT